MFHTKIYLDLFEEGILSEVTRLADEPFMVYEEQAHHDDTVTFRMDARTYRDEIYFRLRASNQVTRVKKVKDTHLLIRKEAMGALPIIRENHGKMQGIDCVYGTKRILDVVVFRLNDLREMMTDLRDISDVHIGKLLPVAEPTSRLTERQQTVIQLALENGYYNWPRDIDASELASELEITHTTLLEHLRKAEGTLLEISLSSESTAPSPKELEFLLSSQ